MKSKNKEGSIICDLSKRITEAQSKIGILEHLKWDESIKKDFFKHKAQRLPNITAEYYQKDPLPYVIEDKIAEFRHILRDAHHQLGEYSAMTRLINRQCEEYIRALVMLGARGTPLFVDLAHELYGEPMDAFYPGGPRLASMATRLYDILNVLDIQVESEADRPQYTALQARSMLQQRLDRFFSPYSIEILVKNDMVSDAAAGGERISLNQSSLFSEREIRSLEVHEGWVHVATTLNGRLQPCCHFLSKGAPSCSVIQEGLAVLTEMVTLSSSPARMKKITNRVIAIDKVTQGANFLDLYHYFLETGLSEEDSYNHCVRVFRGSTPTGGPFTKDLSYAKGLVLVYTFLGFALRQKRLDVIPLLFCGKLMLSDIPLLLELKEEGFLADPIFLPPNFKDLSALSAWMSLSLYLNAFDHQVMDQNFKFLLG